MSETGLATRNSTVDLGVIERVVALGDLSKLSPEERARYYFEVCKSVGLNPMTRPFEYLMLNGRLLLYARKDATDQLRALHRISLEITLRETINDLYVVTARARTPDGRTDEEIGAVSIKDKAGDDLANCLMKASTKAKRRVTLSICGLGLLDESELETVRDAVVLSEPTTYGSRQIEDGEQPALPASRSGAAERLQAEIDGLDAERVPTSPAYRRCVAVCKAAAAAGVQNVPDVPKHFDDQQWTDMANTWERALRATRRAR